MARARDFPENGELVVCTVTRVKNFGAFVTLDEYDQKEGFIHVRDVTTGWVKYIRDYVREGQKVVCKVLGVDSQKGHIDLSLKSVNDHQKRERIQHCSSNTCLVASGLFQYLSITEYPRVQSSPLSPRLRIS